MNLSQYRSVATAIVFMCAIPIQAATVSIGQTEIDNVASRSKGDALVNSLGHATYESIVEGCFVDALDAVSYYNFPISGDLSNATLHFAVQVPGGDLPPGTTWLANPVDLILLSENSRTNIDLEQDPYGSNQPVSGVFPITHVLPASATDVTNILIRAEFFGGHAPESCLVAVPEPEAGVMVFGIILLAMIRGRRR